MKSQNSGKIGSLKIAKHSEEQRRLRKAKASDRGAKSFPEKEIPSERGAGKLSRHASVAVQVVVQNMKDVACSPVKSQNFLFENQYLESFLAIRQKHHRLHEHFLKSEASQQQDVLQKYTSRISTLETYVEDLQKKVRAQEDVLSQPVDVNGFEFQLEEANAEVRALRFANELTIQQMAEMQEKHDAQIDTLEEENERLGDELDDVIKEADDEKKAMQEQMKIMKEKFTKALNCALERNKALSRQLQSGKEEGKELGSATNNKTDWILIWSSMLNVKFNLI